MELSLVLARASLPKEGGLGSVQPTLGVRASQGIKLLHCQSGIRTMSVGLGDVVRGPDSVSL